MAFLVAQIVLCLPHPLIGCAQARRALFRSFMVLSTRCATAACASRFVLSADRDRSRFSLITSAPGCISSPGRLCVLSKPRLAGHDASARQAVKFQILRAENRTSTRSSCVGSLHRLPEFAENRDAETQNRAKEFSDYEGNRNCAPDRRLGYNRSKVRKP